MAPQQWVPVARPAVTLPHAAASAGLGDSIRGCSGTLWCHLADACPTSIAALRWCGRAAVRLWFLLLFSLGAVQPHPPVFRAACTGTSSPTALPTPFCPPSLSTPTVHLNTGHNLILNQQHQRSQARLRFRLMDRNPLKNPASWSSPQLPKLLLEASPAVQPPGQPRGCQAPRLPQQGGEPETRSHSLFLPEP